MKQIKILILIVTVLTGVITYSSCQSSESEPIENVENSQSLKGVEEFRASLIQLSQKSISRSTDEDPSEKEIEELVNNSRDFLAKNDITNEDLDIEEDDEILAVVAMGLLDYQKTVNPISRTTTGGCILEALGVKDIVASAGKSAVKYVAKAVANAALKKAIPYVGWGLFAWDFISCVTE